MSEAHDAFGQPVGFALPGWKPPPPPPRTPMHGRFCSVEPLDPARHAADLFAANAEGDGKNWTYMSYGPFSSLGNYLEWVHETCLGDDPLFYAIVDAKTEEALGVASYLRIQPASGAIEVGNIHYSPRLQRTAAATEAMYLLMRRAFELGYRRYEWKCDSLNAASRTAAQRLGFSLEGVFRQATVYKERNRDTAWYAIIDRDWPALESAFRRWLDVTNFDHSGQPRSRLSELTAPSPPE